MKKKISMLFLPVNKGFFGSKKTKKSEFGTVSSRPGKIYMVTYVYQLNN